MSSIRSFSQLESQYSQLIESQQKPYLVVDRNGELCFTSFEGNFTILFYKYVLGYSFDCSTVAHTLNKEIKGRLKVVPRIDQFTSNQEKIEYLRKTLQTAAIAYKVLISTQDGEEGVERCSEDAQHTVQLSLSQIVSHLAQLEKKSCSHLYLEFDLPLLAYKHFSRDEEFENSELDLVPQHYLEKLVELCCQFRNVKGLLFLARHGVDVVKFAREPYTFKYLIRLGLAADDEEAIYSLLKSASKEEINGFVGIPLIFVCACKGFEKAVRLFIEKGLVSSLKDPNGALLLYYSLCSMNHNLIQYVLSKVDPAQMDSQGETAFSRFLRSNIDPHDKRQLIYGLFADDEEFLQFLPQNFSVRSTRIGDLPVSHLILVYILGDRIDQEKYILSISREQFEEECKRIQERFPQADISAFILKHFSFYEEHYTTGCENVHPGRAPEGVRLSRLLSLFDEAIRHDDLSSILGTLSAQETRQSLSKYINNVVQRNQFLGTPVRNTDAFQEFYDEITLLLLHIIRALHEKRDYVSILNCVRQFAEAAHKCGGRYFSTAVEQYLILCEGRSETPLSRILKVIAEFRAILFQNAVIAATQTSEVHNHNAALRDMGEQYGILGYENARRFNDMYIGDNYNKRAIELEFLKQYTPRALVNDWLLPLLKSEGEIREQYIDWHEKYIPDTWGKEKYNPIYEGAFKIQSARGDNVRELIKEYLLHHDIYITSSQSWEEAIEQDRISSYLSDFVYCDNEISFEGVLYFLERSGVLKSKLRFSDKSKEIEPIHIEEVSFYSQLQRILQRFMSLVNDLIEKILSILQTRSSL